MKVATRYFDKVLQLVRGSSHTTPDNERGEERSHGGFFGEVYRCRLRGLPVVVKRLGLTSLHGLPALSDELVMRLSAINSKHLSNLLGYCSEPQEVTAWRMYIGL